MRQPRAFWRVGRQGKRPVIYQRHFGRVALETYLLQYSDDGVPKRIVNFDRRRIVQWWRTFDRSAGLRYSQRRRDGSNDLDGCGMMQVESDKQGLKNIYTLRDGNFLDKSFDNDGFQVAGTESMSTIWYDNDTYWFVSVSIYSGNISNLSPS